MATHSSILAWRIPGTEEPGGLLSMGLHRVADFWLKNGWDHVNGGVYTCLDREGKVFSTDKSVWMQGRCGWIYAWLCRLYGVREDWLAASKSCLDFMEALRLSYIISSKEPCDSRSFRIKWI